MGACYGFGVLGKYPSDLSLEEKKAIITQVINFNPSRSFYEKIDDNFYRCAKKNGLIMIEPVSAQQAKKMSEIWKQGYGSMPYSSWASLGGYEIIYPKFSKKTKKLTLNNTTAVVESAALVISSISSMNREYKHELQWKIDAITVEEASFFNKFWSKLFGPKQTDEEINVQKEKDQAEADRLEAIKFDMDCWLSLQKVLILAKNNLLIVTIG